MFWNASFDLNATSTKPTCGCKKVMHAEEYFVPIKIAIQNILINDIVRLSYKL